MTINGVSEKSDGRRLSWWAIALVMTFAIAAFFLTRPVTSPQSLSPVAGLMTLKASAQRALPYERAIANGKPSLIEFYADWCTTCQALAPVLESVRQDFGHEVNLVMLNIDDPQWREQVQQFHVTGVPHLALVKADGAIADTFIGKVPRPVLAHRLADLLE